MVEIHWQHPIKCLSCGLHFLVCSWSEWWPRQEMDDETPNPVCPECGSDVLLHWAPILNTKQQIYAVVPGRSSRLVSFGKPVKS